MKGRDDEQGKRERFSPTGRDPLRLWKARSSVAEADADRDAMHLVSAIRIRGASLVAADDVAVTCQRASSAGLKFDWRLGVGLRLLCLDSGLMVEWIQGSVDANGGVIIGC